jgi:hypothetical protein
MIDNPQMIKDMKLSIDTLNKYYSDGWLIKQVHPELPLIIWNYSQNTQYEGFWDEITLQCRGLVTDEDGNVIARPFKKFFNFEENKHTPTKEFEVFEKMDGSLGILFCYNEKWHLATRGSFTSDQSIKGKELLSKYNLDFLSPGYTYMFEIIFHENRIVCDYDFEDLVMLACIETTDGGEVDIHSGYYEQEFNVVKKYDDVTDYKLLKDKINDNAEGFVIKFSNGERMKIKGEEYLRLHRIMTTISTKSVWEILLNDECVEDYLVDVPDEFFDIIKEYENELRDNFINLETEHINIFRAIQAMGYREIDKRREFAEVANESKIPSVLFSMLDGKDYSKAIWQYLKPKFRKL